MTPRLVELRVRDLGVIDDVTVELGAGMTALTGETGAGKTLLVDALSLLLGGRAEPATVRRGADESLIEAKFADDGGGDPDAAETVLTRSVARVGRSRSWIDGRMVTVATLGDRARELLELHGQHQHRALVTAGAQRRALDAFGGIERGPLEVCRGEVARLESEIARCGGDDQARAREADFLRFQLDEITAAAVTDEAEDERLDVEEDRLAAASDHRRAAAEAVALLADLDEQSALDRLAQASRTLAARGPLAAFDERLRAQMADLSDLVSDLRTVVETWEDDPARLAAVRERRQRLRDLERKYGPRLADVLAHVEDTARRLAGMEEDERRAAGLDDELRAARHRLVEVECRVADARRRAAPALGADVEARLRGLAMADARFQVQVEGSGPADQVSFWLGANPGEPLVSLARSASGGELSRAMLALRLAVSTGPPVMVFDEVDAGVGGAAAITVGAALAQLGVHRQVLVVTHLAQVAAQADHQIAVRKHELDSRTRAEVTALDPDARVVEVSRMLSGRPDSASARRHARELLRPARPGR